MGIVKNEDMSTDDEGGKSPVKTKVEQDTDDDMNFNNELDPDMDREIKAEAGRDSGLVGVKDKMETDDENARKNVIVAREKAKKRASPALK